MDGLTLIYLLPLLAIVFLYLKHKKAMYAENLVLQQEEFDAGLTEPPSLHPVIDRNKCLACRSCVEACPEKNVLGIIHGKAELIAPTHCIGHGACRTACPFDAITLVFGTEKRGVDIPLVKPTFETNVPGIFIAGELGGMGLIRNAVTQGRQAMDSIRGLLKNNKPANDIHDVVIIGAGPAGFSASLAAIEHGLSYVTLEQDSLGGTVSHYPRGKVVMTQPAVLPVVGKTTFTETTKEELLEFWEGVVEQSGVEINFSERVETVTNENSVFTVKTSKGDYKTRAILLAIGRRGTPRKLGVPGEDQSKVVYRLIDPEQYQADHVLVVGGGDSALEAATSIADISEGSVALSYRSEAFSRAKQKNRDRVAQAEADGKLKVLMKSNVKEIRENEIVLDQEGEEITLPNTAVIVCAGGILPTPFLKEIGIEVETKFGTE